MQYVDTDNEGSSFVSQEGDNTSKTGALNVEQNIYRGGKTLAEIRAARSLIASQRYAVFSTEQDTLLQAVTAYMNVLRDRAVIELNEKNLEVVSKQYQQSQDRYDVGDISQTDVSQSKARLADAQASLIRAKGNLKSTHAEYQRIIGDLAPEELSFPYVIFTLPETLSEALEIAENSNPAIKSAEFFHAFSEENVDSTFAELLPQVSLSGSLSKAYDPQPGFLDEQDTTTVGLFATIPLYQSGSTRSRVRQAKSTANQRFMDIIDTRDQVKQQTVSNWENLKTAQAEILARQAQVEAAADSQKGLRLEAEVGQRTIIDALDADREYLNSEVALITARRDEIVAHYALASSLGLLNPYQLGFPEVAIDYEAELQGKIVEQTYQ